jgi:hypothetical protein
MEEDRFTRITLRIPKDVHQQLEAAAAATAKSMNAEIVARLQESFQPHPAEERLQMSKQLMTDLVRVVINEAGLLGAKASGPTLLTGAEPDSAGKKRAKRG